MAAISARSDASARFSEWWSLLCGGAAMAHFTLVLFNHAGGEKSVFCFSGKFSIPANGLQTPLKNGRS